MTTSSLPVAERMPASIAASRSYKRRHRVRTAVMLAVAAAVVAAVVIVAGRIGRSEAPAYRTAIAGSQQIEAQLSSVATIEPVTEANVAFPVAGTVSTLDVAVGDTVEVGQQLATLDTATLEQALRKAQASLAQAQLVLQTALDGDDPSALLGGGGGMQGVAYVVSADPQASTAGYDSATGSAAFTFASALVAVSDSDLSTAQQAVLAAQSAVSSAIAAASTALDNATSVCAAVGSSVTVTTDPSDPTAAPTVDTSPIAACQAALNAVLAAQQQASTAQSDLVAAANALDALLDQQAADLGSGGSTTTTTPSTTPADGSAPTTVPTDPSGSVPDGSTPDGATDGSLPSGAGGGGFGGGSGGAGSIGGSSSNTPSSEDLISYQASVDAATIDVTVAQQEIAQATIVSPIAGTVIATGFAAGDSVEAASSDAAIVIQGEGGYEATTSVSIDDVPDVSVGQAATLDPDGATGLVDGQVSAISVVPDSTGSTTTYRVTVSLTGDTSKLGNGATGTLRITTGTATATVAVPTSAVTWNDGTATVTVIGADGAATATPVRVGVIGAAYTEITSGIDAGAIVAVADLSEPLPSQATSSSNGESSTGNGSFTFPGGGGFPGGGFPGGN